MELWRTKVRVRAKNIISISIKSSILWTTQSFQKMKKMQCCKNQNKTWPKSRKNKPLHFRQKRSHLTNSGFRKTKEKKWMKEWRIWILLDLIMYWKIWYRWHSKVSHLIRFLWQKKPKISRMYLKLTEAKELLYEKLPEICRKNSSLTIMVRKFHSKNGNTNKSSSILSRATGQWTASMRLIMKQAMG